MILYHYTNKTKLNSVLLRGLKPNKLGIVYLTPNPAEMKGFGNVLLEVETGELRLTYFDGCNKWEVLCWGHITSKNIKVV